MRSQKLFKTWKRCNYVVALWILNTISKELLEAFLYTTTVRELWIEIAERFGESNGPRFIKFRDKLPLFHKKML